MQNRTMLVPVDYTGHAHEVVATATELASRLQMDVVLLYVVQVPFGLAPDALVASPTGPMAAQVIEMLDDDAREHLSAFVEAFRAAGCGVRLAIRHGSIAQGILHVAEAVDAGMIVMGTHGRRGWTRLVQGSVAEDVLRRAECPVTIVQGKQPDDFDEVEPELPTEARVIG